MGTTDTIILCTLLAYRDLAAVKEWQMQQVGEPIDRFVMCGSVSRFEKGRKGEEHKKKQRAHIYG